MGRVGERFEPEPFGPVMKGEAVAALAREAGGGADGFPAGGLVTSAGVALRIGEGLGQERRVTVLGEPWPGQRGGGGGEDWGGEIEPADGVRDEEAGLVDEEIETLGAGERIPADPGVAILEMEGGGAPQQQTDPVAVLLGDLIETVAGGETGAEEMFGRQEGVEALAVGEVGEPAHGQGAVGGGSGRGSQSRFHPNLPWGGQGRMLSRK